jgi:hypothetical protein
MFANGVIVHAKSVDHTWSKLLEDDVRFGSEVEKHVTPRFRLEIDPDAPFATVCPVENPTYPALCPRFFVPDRITGFRVFDPDHVCSTVREQLCPVRSRE